MTTALTLNIMGWVATACALLAYGFSENKIIRGGGGVHIALNAICGILFIIVGVGKGVSSMIGLNAAWLLIALVSLMRLHKNQIKPNNGVQMLGGSGLYILLRDRRRRLEAAKNTPKRYQICIEDPDPYGSNYVQSAAKHPSPTGSTTTTTQLVPSRP